jgi:hypothetical protein
MWECLNQKDPGGIAFILSFLIISKILLLNRLIWQEKAPDFTL